MFNKGDKVVIKHCAVKAYEGCKGVVTMATRLNAQVCFTNPPDYVKRGFKETTMNFPNSCLVLEETK